MVRAGAVTLAMLAGCSSPKAVQTFAAMAPDPAIAAGLAKSYAAEPAWNRQLHAVWAVPSSAPVTDRASQVQGIVGIDSAIRQYMQALGALAADGVVQAGTNVADVKTGLAALQQAEPAAISTADIGAVTAFVQFATDLAETGYRNAKLAQVIGQAQPAFQQALAVQIGIVRRGIEPSLREYANGYADAQANLAPVSPLLRYAVNRQLAADAAAAATELAAAEAYLAALRAIQQAHTALYDDRDRVLTAAMLTQIKAPAEDAFKAFQALRTADAAAN